MTITTEEFKQALSLWTSGVCIVTTHAGGMSHGMTVSSFGSVCCEPKLVSVCLAERSRTLDLVLKSKLFAVNMLSVKQRALSERFSASASGLGRLTAGSYELGPANCPLLNGALVQLECALASAHVAGDHRVLIGEVSFARMRAGDPLLYHSRTYRSLAPA